MGRILQNYVPKQQRQSSGMVVPKVSIGGVNLVDPKETTQLAGQEAAATTGARLGTEQAFSQKQNEQFLNQVTSLGKPYSELNFEDIYKATKNLDMTKKFLDTRNSFSGKDTNQQKFLEASKGIIEAFIEYAKKIPSLSGALRGKQYKQRMNEIEAKLGTLPEYESYRTMTTLVAPMFVKAFGDSGNVPEQQVALVKPALENLASGQSELRKTSQDILELIFSKVTGKPIKFGINPTPTSFKDLSDEDLFKILGQ